MHHLLWNTIQVAATETEHRCSKDTLITVITTNTLITVFLFMLQAGLMPLHIASFVGLAEITSELILRGADVNAATSRGETPLHFAARCGRAEVTSLLLTAGAKVDVPTIKVSDQRCLNLWFCIRLLCSTETQN